ncbi:MAG: transporter [Gillisia sp.]
MRYSIFSCLFLFLCLLFSINATAQYTETINSNRPGNSQGAFSVGRQVLQLEAGAYLGNDEHNLYKTSTDIWGTDYELRYGFLFEELEISLNGAFEADNTTLKVGPNNKTYKISNFKSNTLGLKYLIFDPAVSLEPEKPNLYSWKANHRFKWRRLIPAVSVYAGANLAFGDNPFLQPGEGKFSPKIALITQNNWRDSWVLVMNFIADKISEDNPSFEGIATLTHAFTPQFAGFIEYHGIINDIYADDLARTGLAYLFTKDFQIDVSGLINFKDTPARWQLAAGLSYRLDFHSQDEYLEAPTEKDNAQKKGTNQLQKDKRNSDKKNSEDKN